MKCWISSLVCILVCLSIAPSAWAQEVAASVETSKSAPSADLLAMFSPSAKKAQVTERLRLGVDAWYTMGEGSWEISYAWLDPDFLLASGRSVLEWEDIDSLMTVLHAELTLYPWLKLSGRYGAGDINDGKTTDADYESAPLYFVRDFQVLESESQAEGETEIYDISAHFILSALQFMETYPGEIDLFAGYQHYTDELQMNDGVWTLVDEVPVREPFDEELASTYDFEWTGIRIGVGLSYPLLKQLHVAASLAQLVAVEYEGEGLWNLRDEFRDTGPSFIHEGDEGIGADAAISLTYLPLENLGFQVGYRYTHWEVENGTDTTYFDEGSLSTSLDKAESTRHGVYAGLFGCF